MTICVKNPHGMKKTSVIVLLALVSSSVYGSAEAPPDYTRENHGGTFVYNGGNSSQTSPQSSGFIGIGGSGYGSWNYPAGSVEAPPAQPTQTHSNPFALTPENFNRTGMNCGRNTQAFRDTLNQINQNTQRTNNEPTVVQSPPLVDITQPNSIDLSTIPDPININYDFVSTNTDVSRLYTDLFKIHPLGPGLNGYSSDSRNLSRSIGMRVTQSADQSFASGNSSEGHALLQLGQGFLDIALGLNPVTGTTISAYEFISGYRITGEQLSELERGSAFIGMVSGGLGRFIPGIARVVRSTRNLIRGYETAENIIQRREQNLLTENEIQTPPTTQVAEQSVTTNIPTVITRRGGDPHHTVTRVFHRRDNPETQTRANVDQIIRSGELWGKAPRNGFGGFEPTVQAYEGPLPEGINGFEFTTRVAPDSGGMPNGKWHWSGDGLRTFEHEGHDMVSIPIENIRRIVW